MKEQQVVFTFARKRKAGRGKKLGRPKQPSSRVRHGAREALRRCEPQHITLRLVRGLPSLRTREVLEVLWQVFTEAKDRNGLRICHWVVLSNHIHLIVEADDQAALASGLNGLLVRIARRVNPVFGRRGKFFDGRYHVRPLRTPQEVRHAVRYVLTNARHHGVTTAGPIDPFSSGPWFDGWTERVEVVGGPPERPLAAPRSWLLRTAGRRELALPSPA